jgi:hypothetical protein
MKEKLNVEKSKLQTTLFTYDSNEKLDTINNNIININNFAYARNLVVFDENIHLVNFFYCKNCNVLFIYH